MATINLGSIKFNWQGAYNGATAYAVDDVVSYNGSSYICTAASTGNLPTDTNYWDQMSSAGTDGTDLTSTLTTQGDIIYRDASGLARLGAGTAGQVLQTGGAGANPSWGTVSSDYVKIASNDLTSAVGSVSFDNVFSSSDDYAFYEAMVDYYPVTDSVNPYVRFLTSTGAEQSGSHYHWVMGGVECNTAAAYNISQVWGAFDDNKLVIGGVGGTVDNDTTSGGIHLKMQIFQAPDSKYSFVKGHYTIVRGASSDNLMGITFHGAYRAGESHRGIKFAFDSGNVASGTFRLYGVK